MLRECKVILPYQEMAWQVGFLVLAISIIGFLTLFNQVYKLVKWIWCTFFRTPKDLTTYGSWALVTGCTDGIGKTLAFELASRGLNLILVSRNSNKLQQTLNEIREKFGEAIQMKIIVIDFAKTSIGKEIEELIRKEIEGLDVGILVNNAGVNGNSPRFFHEFDSKEIKEVVDVNIGGLTWVARAVLHGMMKRQKGAIVNIGSGSSEVPSYPLCDVYAATKAYVAMLSKSLSLEYKQYGIDIQCQVPMYVMTNMTSVAVRRPSIFIPSAKTYSEASVTRIGYESLCFPYWNHAIQWWLISEVLPEFLVNWVNLATALKVRRKVLRKHYSINM